MLQFVHWQSLWIRFCLCSAVPQQRWQLYSRWSIHALVLCFVENSEKATHCCQNLAMEPKLKIRHRNVEEQIICCRNSADRAASVGGREWRNIKTWPFLSIHICCSTPWVLPVDCLLFQIPASASSCVYKIVEGWFTDWKRFCRYGQSSQLIRGIRSAGKGKIHVTNSQDDGLQHRAWTWFQQLTRVTLLKMTQNIAFLSRIPKWT